MTGDGIYNVAKYIEYTLKVIIIICTIAECFAPPEPSQPNVHIHRPVISAY